MQSGFVEINGRKLYYEMMGEGRPLVLLHAAGMNRKMWDDQFEVFAQHYKVIRYDARGVGNSDVPQQSFSLSEVLYKLLTFLGVNKAYVLGISLGGITAIDFYLEYPEMVDSLIVVSSGISGYVFSQEYQQKVVKIGLAIKEGVLAFVNACLEDPTLAPAKEYMVARQKVEEMLIENFKALSVDYTLARSLQPPAIERLSEITIPTLIILGERDDKDFHTIGNILHKGINSSQYVMISNVGHLLNMEKPGEFNKIILDFLSKQSN